MCRGRPSITSKMKTPGRGWWGERSYVLNVWDFTPDLSEGARFQLEGLKKNRHHRELGRPCASEWADLQAGCLCTSVSRDRTRRHHRHSLMQRGSNKYFSTLELPNFSQL